VAVVATRRPKRDQRLEDFEAEWQWRATQVGLTPGRIDQMLDRSRQITPPDPETTFERLASPEGLTAQASTFTTPDVVREIAAALPEGGTRDQIETLAEVFLADGEVIPLLPRRGSEEAGVLGVARPVDVESAGVSVTAEAVAKPMRRRDGGMFPSPELHRYTTAELLATEQRIIDHALAGVGAGHWRVPRRLVEAELRRRHHLTDGQVDMVRRFATSGNIIDVGIGPAGTGKTAVMGVISHLSVFTGTPIVGAALAAKAAAGLESATGIPSTTLARLLNQPGDTSGLPAGVVVVVDEAAMVGTRQLAAVCDLVEQAAGKLILIGDDHQMPEIDAGGLFRALANRLPAVSLADNIRQHEAWERVALAELRHGSVEHAIEMYRKNRRLSAGNRDEMIAQAVDDWHRHVTATGDPTSGLLIARDNDTVAELNEQARSRLAASKRLDEPTLETNDMVLQAGDRILCRQNQHRLNILNGDLGTVDSVNPDSGSLAVRLDRDPETRNLPSWYLDHGHVDYGYALTGHKAQGVTTSRAFTLITGGTDREWVYVAMSRGRQANTLYLATPEPGNEQCTHLTHPERQDPVDTLVASLGRNAAETAAIDHVVGPPPPSSDVADRVAWIVARRRAERDKPEHTPPGIGLTANR
jgi:hypothetical protein